MGSGNSKTSPKVHEHLSATEQEQLQSYFGTICSVKQQNCKEEELRDSWKDIVDEYLLRAICHHFFKHENSLNFETFIRLFTQLNRGTAEDRATVLTYLLDGNKDEVRRDVILEYVEHIISSFVKAYEKSRNYQSWSKNLVMPNEDLKALSNYLCSDLSDSPLVTAKSLESWIFSWTLLLQMQTTVFLQLYNLLDSDSRAKNNFIPLCNGMPSGIPFPSILSWPNIIFLNSSLPVDFREEWRFLFSTKIHGESFSKIIDRVLDQGPTVIIVRDTDGYVFGGFAPHSWKLRPHFVGDETSFVFCLKPTVNKFDPTGYNNHFQYLNVQQQTLPNGLGMGGQFSYFGLWLSSEFGTGHCSETCTTYKNYKMLSGKKNFEIDHIEIWGVGVKPKAEETPQKSVLDSHQDARAVLEMAGKARYSEGYREPEEE